MRLLLKQVVIKTKKMIINKKYRKWLPIPIIVGIVIIQTVAILSILGYHWLIEKGMIPQGRDTAITGRALYYLLFYA